MKLQKPKNVTFIIAVVLAVLGILGSVATIPLVTAYAIWFVFAGFVLLALGVLLKGL